MTKVVIANRWTDPAGKVHKGGQTVEVEPGVARDLIMRGKAREVPAESKAEPSVRGKNPKTEPPKTPAKTGTKEAPNVD